MTAPVGRILAPMEGLQPGHVLGQRYELAECLSTGGAREVWLVRDLRLNRPLALKILHPRIDGGLVHVQRFREEALIGARLSHPNIVAVHDFAEDDGLLYMVMEYVPGRTLDRVLAEQGSLPADDVRRIVVQVAAALNAAAEAGVVHRDLQLDLA